MLYKGKTYCYPYEETPLYHWWGNKIWKSANTWVTEQVEKESVLKSPIKTIQSKIHFTVYLDATDCPRCQITKALCTVYNAVQCLLSFQVNPKRKSLPISPHLILKFKRTETKDAEMTSDDIIREHCVFPRSRRSVNKIINLHSHRHFIFVVRSLVSQWYQETPATSIEMASVITMAKVVRPSIPSVRPGGALSAVQTQVPPVHPVRSDMSWPMIGPSAPCHNPGPSSWPWLIGIGIGLDVNTWVRLSCCLSFVKFVLKKVLVCPGSKRAWTSIVVIIINWWRKCLQIQTRTVSPCDT